MPSPHVSFSKRVLQQDIEYDWLGNTVTSDDDAHGFYDRSLGDITNDAEHGRPYQLASANNTKAGGGRTGSLATKYDVAGNLTDMVVTRNGPCLPSGSSCNQRFHYGWDEVGRLVRAQRWDTATAVNQEPSGSPVVDLAYAYDASDNRVLKSATANEGPSGNVQRHAVYISGGQELRGAQFGTGYGLNGAADYQLDSATEVAYLFAHGVRLGRVAYDTKASTSDGMPLFSAINPLPQQHVLLNLDDTLGSTAIVIDRETGELVESTAYLANGATESDYRAERWKGLREDYRFTGKEEDVEVGLQYFGKRFLSPYIGRWVSADPLGVHVPGKADFSLYAYVSGAVLKAIDPLGLTDRNGEQGGASSTGSSVETEGTSSTQAQGTGQPTAGDVSVAAVCGASGPTAAACALMSCPGDSVQKNMNPADEKVRAEMAIGSAGYGVASAASKGYAALKDAFSKGYASLKGALSTAPRAMPKPAVAPSGNPVGEATGPTMTSAATGEGTTGTRTLDQIAQALQETPKGPTFGGGGTLDKLTPREIQRIQNAANRTKTEIAVVGSRVNPNKALHAGSDYDYVINANSATRRSAASSLPGSKNIGEGIPGNQDIFKGEVDPSRPHVIFSPR